MGVITEVPCIVCCWLKFLTLFNTMLYILLFGTPVELPSINVLFLAFLDGFGGKLSTLVEWPLLPSW